MRWIAFVATLFLIPTSVVAKKKVVVPRDSLAAHGELREFVRKWREATQNAVRNRSPDALSQYYDAGFLGSTIVPAFHARLKRVEERIGPRLKDIEFQTSRSKVKRGKGKTRTVTITGRAVWGIPTDFKGDLRGEIVEWGDYKLEVEAVAAEKQPQFRIVFHGFSQLPMPSAGDFQRVLGSGTWCPPPGDAGSFLVGRKNHLSGTTGVWEAGEQYRFDCRYSAVKKGKDIDEYIVDAKCAYTGKRCAAGFVEGGCKRWSPRVSKGRKSFRFKWDAAFFLSLELEHEGMMNRDDFYALSTRGNVGLGD